jgi:diguanylate cyclase (GGDEF)-like protein/PAS domain S-box-containing protein
MTRLVKEREANTTSRLRGSDDAVALAQQLAGERERWDAVFRHAPNGIALIDTRGRWLAVNDALCRLLDRTADDLLGGDFQDLIHPEDPRIDVAEMRRALAGGTHRYEVETRYLRASGEPVWTRLSVVLVRATAEEPQYFLAHIQEGTGQRESEAQMALYTEQLEELASQDPLTGLRNYRTFHTRLTTELNAAQSAGSECSIVLFDLDNFRDLTRRDHFEGDQLLERVGTLVAGACRSTDVAARIGPDEFALILPETNRSLARTIAHRIAGEIERDNSVSASFGIGTWPVDGDHAELLLRADAELQTAKHWLHSGLSDNGVRAGDRDRLAQEIRQVVSLAHRFLNAEAAYLTKLDGGTETVRILDGDAERVSLREGGAAPAFDVANSDSHKRNPQTTPLVADRPPPIPQGAALGTIIGVPIRLNDGHLYGAFCVVLSEPVPDTTEADLDLLRSLASVITSKIESDLDDAERRRHHEELAGMNALLSALTARDHYTGEHSKTVVRLAVAVARRMELDDETIHQVEQVALLHDIGKVGIPDAILQKSGPLTGSEWKLMREHPAIGARILAGTRTLAHLAPAVQAEHERFDGEGYPNGLGGSSIPVASRITLACDAYDAMTTDRPYRTSLGAAHAVKELVAGAGTQFDPDVIAALIAEIHEQSRSGEAHQIQPILPNPASDLDQAGVSDGL